MSVKRVSYRVMSGTSDDEIQQQVMCMLDLGWKCQGGVSCVLEGKVLHWFQAMIKED